MLAIFPMLHKILAPLFMPYSLLLLPPPPPSPLLPIPVGLGPEKLFFFHDILVEFCEGVKLDVWDS